MISFLYHFMGVSHVPTPFHLLLSLHKAIARSVEFTPKKLILSPEADY